MSETEQKPEEQTQDAAAPAPATFSFAPSSGTAAPAPFSFGAPAGDGAAAGGGGGFTFSGFGAGAEAAPGGGFSFTSFGNAGGDAGAAAATDDGGDDEAPADGLDDAVTNPQAKALVHLDEVEVKTMEEDEDVLLEMRARLYRMDAEAGEWKERGRGVVKFLKHRENEKIRILMRRDQTLKVCCNHYISPLMELTPNVSSDRSWIWTTPADFADVTEREDARPETLAIKFASVEHAQEFKKVFEDAGQHNADKLNETVEGDEEGGEAAE